MIHIAIPPMSSAQAITFRLPRFFSLHLCSSSAGADVHAKAINVSEMGWFSQMRSPFSPLGKVRMKSTIRLRNSSSSARIAPS